MFEVAVPGGGLAALHATELRDLIAEEAEFGLDPAPAPGWVLSGHAADVRAELKIERRATR